MDPVVRVYLISNTQNKIPKTLKYYARKCERDGRYVEIHNYRRDLSNESYSFFDHVHFCNLDLGSEIAAKFNGSKTLKLDQCWNFRGFCCRLWNILKRSI